MKLVKCDRESLVLASNADGYSHARVDVKDANPTFDRQVCTTARRASIIADLARVNSTVGDAH